MAFNTGRRSSSAAGASGEFDGIRSSSNSHEKNLTSTASIEVDKMLLRFLVGKGGSTRQKLEKDNDVTLSIPSTAEAEAETRLFVTIKGSEDSVKAASTAIRKVLDEAVTSKLQYTHFISLPLAVHPALVEKLNDFQESVLASTKSSLVGSETSLSDDHYSDDSGIEESIFIKPARFHLTILMMKLWNEERVKAASKVLETVSKSLHETFGGEPVFVDLQGLECLRGTAEEAHVLYARIQDSKHKSRLLQGCQILTNAFIEAGLVLERDIGQKLTLHATLMNTTHRKSRKSGWSSKRKPFDARDILAKYGSWDWGEYPILEAHLSERFVYDDNGYYHCVSSIPFA